MEPSHQASSENQARRRTTTVLALVLAAAVLAAGCSSSSESVDASSETTAPTSAVVAEPTATTAAPTPVTTSADTPTTEAPNTTAVAEPPVDAPRYELTGELDLTVTELNDMVTFVEDTMGREFITPPKIVMQSVEEFEAGLAPTDEVAQIQKDSAETSARFLQAIGYTELSPDDLLENLTDLGTSTDLISGRYVPFDDTVYIPEGALVGDMFNAILVHELAHALDGQYVDMQSMIETLEAQLTEEVSGDDAFSIRATIEGRATSVQIRWMMANNVTPVVPETPASYTDIPPSVILGVQLPYQLGAQSVEALGGPAESWGLFDEFPTSSEQMMFADRIGTDLPQDVAAPAAEAEILDEGLFGAESLLLLLIGDSLAPSQVDIITSIGAVDGLGGGYYVLDGDASTSCLRVNLTGDTADELAEIEAKLTEWAAKESTPGAERTVSVDGDVLLLTACAPFIS